MKHLTTWTFLFSFSRSHSRAHVSSANACLVRSTQGDPSWALWLLSGVSALQYRAGHQALDWCVSAADSSHPSWHVRTACRQALMVKLHKLTMSVFGIGSLFCQQSAMYSRPSGAGLVRVSSRLLTPFMACTYCLQVITQWCSRCTQLFHVGSLYCQHSAEHSRPPEAGLVRVSSRLLTPFMACTYCLHVSTHKQ